MNEIALILFAYNRPKHLEAALQSLQKCAESESFELFIFCDGPKSSQDVKDCDRVFEITRENWKFRSISVKRRLENLGLANSVISGVSEVLQDFQGAIVMEDDLTFSEDFLRYMSSALFLTRDLEHVFSVSGYSPIRQRLKYFGSAYLAPRIHSWGWGIWRQNWLSVDWSLNFADELFRDSEKIAFLRSGGEDLIPMLFDQIAGRIDSWAVRMAAYASYLQKFTIYPMESLVSNNGHDGSGVHSGTNYNRQSEATGSFNLERLSEKDIRSCKRLQRRFYNYYS